jgi:nucleotide-binding universal stress UspA family protein
VGQAGKGHKANAPVRVKCATGQQRIPCARPHFAAAFFLMAGGRTYLVVIDDSAEARVALRFAARRAVKTGGHVEVLAVVPPQDFVQWGGVQAAMEEDQQLRIEGIVSAAVGELFDEAGIKPEIVLRQGDAVKIVRDYLSSRDDIAALVLGAAESGSPSELVSHFAGKDAGTLACPVMIIPGGLSDERLEQLS